MTTYRHHGGKVVGVVEPARRTATRDSGREIISEYSQSGGPRRAALPDPPEITMPSPTTTQRVSGYGGSFEVEVPPPAEYIAASSPPTGLSTAEIARHNEKYWTQASGLPEVERNRRAGVEYQRYLDRWWAGKPAFASYGAPARDEGNPLWRTICELGQPDGAGDLAGTGTDGRNYRLLRTDGGFTLEQEEVEDVALQPIGDRRAVSSKDSESAALRKMNERNAAFWSRPFR
jgi:hypothetical protein